MNLFEEFPELVPLYNGDPFFEEISKFDDIASDFWEDPLTVAWVERHQLSYELETLYRWWAL